MASSGKFVTPHLHRALTLKAKRISLTQKVVSGTIWLGLSEAANIFCRFGFLLVLARLLTPSEFGVIGVGLAITGILEQIMFLCFGQALVQRPELKDRHVFSTATLLLIIGSTLGGALVCSGLPIAKTYEIAPLAYFLIPFGLIMPLVSLGAVCRALLVRQMHFKFIGLTTMLSQLLGYGPIAIYLASRGFGAHALIAGTILQVFILNIVFIFNQRSNLRFGWSIFGLRELSGFVFGFASYKMADILKGNIDRILIGWLLGTAAVGYYGRTLYLFRIPEGTFGGTALRVLLPAFSRIYDQPTQLERSFRRAWIAVLICGTPVIVIIVACDINLILILLGEQWVDIQMLLIAMGIGFFFRLGNNVSGATITALGLVGQRAKYNWFLLVFASVSYPIGCIWGLRGIGIAYLVTEFLNTVLITRLAVRAVKVPGSQICRLLGNHFIAATSIGTLAWIASNSIYRTTDNPVGGVVIASAIVIIGYVIIVLAVPNFLLFRQQLWLIDTFLTALGRVLPTTVIDRLEMYLRRWEKRSRI